VKCDSDVDDVLLQYIVSILEELGSSAASEDLLDMDQFTEMMEAYLPGFQAVDRSVVIIGLCGACHILCVYMFTSIWYQFLHFQLSYSFTHHF